MVLPTYGGGGTGCWGIVVQGGSGMGGIARENRDFRESTICLSPIFKVMLFIMNIVHILSSKTST